MAELKGVRALMKGALRVIYPPQCLCCGAVVAQEGALCASCWSEAEFLTGAVCDCCGVPVPAGGDARGDGPFTCDDCRTRPKAWAQARGAMRYGGTARSLVLALKYGDRPDLAQALGAWVAQAARPIVRPEMVVVPVPLHPRRLIQRKYNQAALLSARVAQELGLEFIPDALRRVRHTRSQDHRGVEDRFNNVADALAPNHRRVAAIAGRPVLLVDDVLTSGATATAAVNALREVTGPVSVAVLARVSKSD